MTTARAECDDLKQLLSVIINDALTPAGDTTNAATLTTQITNLS